MDCPYCLHARSKVTDGRKAPGGIRRRRECLKCKKRYTTYEKIAKGDLYIIKKDGRRERFDIRKLETGIDKAFEKRHISQEKIDKMINEIEAQQRKKGKIGAEDKSEMDDEMKGVKESYKQVTNIE